MIIIIIIIIIIIERVEGTDPPTKNAEIYAINAPT